MRRVVIAAVALATLAGAPTAAAKEITSVSVCGTGGCVTTHAAAIVRGLTDGGPASAAPAHPAGAVRLRARVTEPGGGTVGRFTTWWVPGTPKLLAEDGTWMDLPPATVAALARLHLEPFGPERLGASFAPASPARVSGSAEGGVDWALAGVLAGAGALAAGALVLVRRRSASRAGP
jgi:hypothetical protein